MNANGRTINYMHLGEPNLTVRQESQGQWKI